MKRKTQSNAIGLILMLASLCSVYSVRAEITPGDTIHAVNYLIDLQEIDMGAQTISANTTVTIVPLVNDLDIIQLQLMELTVDSVFVEQVKVTNFTHTDEIISIPLTSPVSTSDTIDVIVYYHGQPFHEEWGGFHYSGSYAFNLGVGIYWIPHNLGKAWFPCIDDFTDRASYEVRATVAEDLTAVGGGYLASVINNGNGTVTFQWIIDKPIPTYLVSVAVGNYALVEDSYSGIENEIPITYYVVPSDTAKIPGSFQRIHEVMALFEEKFGAYAWPRVGYVGTSKGAMEHASNIAYPNACITGNSSYEWLYVHELSHMWFGDKVTCNSAEEMWINEGWATFCQHYYTEVLYDQETYKLEMRGMHAGVLLSCHTEENGYHPLNNIPQEYTYYPGISTYDKGATVVQALRAYLGDDVFFDACKAYLEDLAFTSLSSYDMEATFTANTGIDMSGFFNNWVYNGGTPHYSIDSFNVDPQMGTSEVTVYVKQKRKGPAFTGDGNIMEVTFMDNDWNQYTDTIHFSGTTGHSTKIVAFHPEEVFIDLEERYFDATIDNYHVITETGETSFPITYFKLDVGEVTDSAFIQATHNFAPADTFAVPVPDLRLSDYRYWTIKGILPETFTAKGTFSYSKSNLDKTLILSETDSLVIFYRKNAGMEWEAVDFTIAGPWVFGIISVENMQMGDYTLGVWDMSVGVEDDQLNDAESNASLHVYPNPSSGKFNFTFDNEVASQLEIYTLSGELIEQIAIDNKKELQWEPGNIAYGTYIAVLRGKSRQAISTEKIVYFK
jgi:aminopeptidase N